MAARDAAIAKVHDLLAADKENAPTSPRHRQLLYRMAYLPQDGMFRLMPADLRLGTYVREAESTDAVASEVGGSARFMWEGQQYRVGDFVYLLPRCECAFPFDCLLPEPARLALAPRRTGCLRCAHAPREEAHS
jgi:hypothetical protein